MRIAGSYFPGLPAQAKASATFCAVCVEHEGSYGVYIGLVEAKHARDESERHLAAAWCQQFGSKVRYDQAIVYFPTLKREQYRA